MCNGEWEELATKKAVSESTIEEWLEYAAVFLGNVGNYYVSNHTLVLTQEER